MKVTQDPFVNRLQGIIHGAVRVMAALMTFVIIMGVLDVLWILYQRLMMEPRYLLKIGDILATFGGFMAVLIAIEIFVNISIYLREDIIHVKIVVATALMAIARKIIVLDLKETSMAQYIPSPRDWVREQVELYESSGGTEGTTLRDTGLPVIIARSRKPRASISPN